MSTLKTLETAKKRLAHALLAQALLNLPIRHAIARIWRFSENEPFLRIALELETSSKSPRVGLLVVIESFLEILAEKGGR